jgi:hypothetical protein
MPFSFRIDIERGLVLFTGLGTFTSKDLLTCLEDVVAHPGFQPHFDHLVDMRQVTDFQPGAEDNMIRAARDRDDVNLQGGRFAIVSSSDLVFGMTRMYETLMNDAGVKVRTFRSMDEAKTWLGLPIDKPEG